MTVSLSAYDEGLLREIGHFCDTILAEQVRAVMIARDNALTKLAAAEASLEDAKTIRGGKPCPTCERGVIIDCACGDHTCAYCGYHYPPRAADHRDALWPGGGT